MKTEKNREQEEARRIGSRIRELREARGWTQRQLSRWTGVAATRLSRIERGLRLPRLLEAMAFREVFALGLEELVFGDPGDRETAELLRRLEALLTPEEGAALRRFLRLVLAGIQATDPSRGRDL